MVLQRVNGCIEVNEYSKSEVLRGFAEELLIEYKKMEDRIGKEEMEARIDVSKKTYAC